MSDPVLTTDHVADGLRKLLIQFRGQPHLQQILSSYLEQIQELEVVFIALIDERYVLTAVGAQLDGVGQIVGELRAGRDDVDYRVAILGRISRNKANGTIEDIIALFGLLLPSHTIVLSEGPGAATLAVEVQEAIVPPDPSAAVLNDELQKSKGGGIRAYLLFSGFPVAERFTFAPGSVPVVDALRGFSDDAMTTGGHFTGLLSS